MNLFDREELNRHNKELNRYYEEKLQKMQKELEALRQNADSCELKKPIINNGYPICPYEVYCKCDVTNSGDSDYDRNTVYYLAEKFGIEL